MNERRRLLVVVAHPDDETFGCGSVIASAVADGAEVVVCCATRGEAGEVHPGHVDDRPVGDIRGDELGKASAILGVSRHLLLGFTDSGMSGDPLPGSLAAASPAHVVDAVRAVVDDVRPDVVVTLDPDHGDGHRDHAAIARATIDACSRVPDVRVYVWAILRPLLARWFVEVGRLRPGSSHLNLDQAQLGRPASDITTVLDQRRFLTVREESMAAHASQVSPYDDMPGKLRRAFLETDHLVRVQPPWTGTAVERSLF